MRKGTELSQAVGSVPWPTAVISSAFCSTDPSFTEQVRTLRWHTSGSTLRAKAPAPGLTSLEMCTGWSSSPRAFFDCLPPRRAFAAGWLGMFSPAQGTGSGALDLPLPNISPDRWDTPTRRAAHHRLQSSPSRGQPRGQVRVTVFHSPLISSCTPSPNPHSSSE